MSHRQLVNGLIAISLAVFNGVLATVAHAHAADGDLFYTTYSGPDRVFTVTYDYDGVSTLLYGTETVVGSTTTAGTALAGADGLVFDPTDPNFLIIGGQNGFFYRLNLTTGIATASSDFSGVGASIFHLAIDPSETSVWGTGIPDSPAINLGLSPFNVGGSVEADASAIRIISGDVGSVTGLTFVGSDAYYTSSGPAGTGSFGTIDLSTGVTTELLAAVPAAHGLAFDAFTGHVFMFGDSHITQFDPVSGTVVSDLDLSSEDMDFDQGTLDAKGHLFVASNTGHMLFVDYSSTGLVADPTNFSDLRFFRDFLDDVAPLSGPGVPTDEQPIPEPTSMLLFGMGSLGAGLIRRGRKLSLNA